MITLTASAALVTTSNNFSRSASDTSFESLTCASSGAKGSANTTDAITSGPAHAPRPASSTPASGVIPASISSDSMTFIR